MEIYKEEKMIYKPKNLSDCLKQFVTVLNPVTRWIFGLSFCIENSGVWNNYLTACYKEI